ncbi:chromosome segregation protein Csm1/Pcs1-domain-containing protein [Xylaria arbuscula]|nr:chromosome segregation protein Csm1/Pcs1-domain-containing protein [Xylaria arbuscula]
MPPAKKGRAAATGRVTKSTRATRAPARNILAEKTENIQDSSAKIKGTKRTASESIDAPEDQDTDNKPRAERSRPRATKARKIAESEEDELSVLPIETTPPQPVKRGRKPKTTVKAEIPETQPEMEPAIEPEKEVPETQQVDMADIDIIEDEPIEELPTYQRQGLSSAQRPRPPLLFGANRRPVSASDSEQNDPILRRRIGELTRKHEALETKYRDLREIGIQEAERNFDRLKKQGEERANTDKQLIAALRAQLAAETEVAKKAEQLRQQLEDSHYKVDELQDRLDGVNSSLAEAKTEIKTLSTKLTAARSAETASVKVPGSAMKNNFANNRHTASVAEAAAQLAHKKENLYGDLTGLLVCGVKRENDEEVFDCVQTGRNGTLHFKLSIINDGSSDKFEDAQFMYMPQLDPARDEDLIETLPDYLVEEITFPRLQASKFFSRVVKALGE